MRQIWVGKRQASRSACLIKAEIRTGDEKFIATCSIVDMSKTGARAKVEAHVEIPAMFALFLPARNETRVCKLRWHRENEIGIEFIAAEQITTFEAVSVLEVRVTALEVAAKTDPQPLAAPPRNPESSSLANRVQKLEIEMEVVLAQADEEPEQAAPQFDPMGLKIELAALTAQVARLQNDLHQANARLQEAPALLADAPDPKVQLAVLDALQDGQKRQTDELKRLEHDVSRTIELVQAQIGESLTQNQPSRIEKLERQNAEILDTLRGLVPLLMSRAS